MSRRQRCELAYVAVVGGAMLLCVLSGADLPYVLSLAVGLPADIVTLVPTMMVAAVFGSSSGAATLGSGLVMAFGQTVAACLNVLLVRTLWPGCDWVVPWESREP